MDWFKRYGIPGAYFLALLVAWLYAFFTGCPLRAEPKELVQLGLFLFLPVGYIISVLGQLCYLKAKGGGLHTEAARRTEVVFVKKVCKNLCSESELEAYSTLNAAINNSDNGKNKNISLNSQIFIQEWIRKRMDVVTINRTIEIATVLAFYAAVIVGLLSGGFNVQVSVQHIVLLVIVSAIILLIMRRGRRTLEEQIAIVISGAWIASTLKGLPFDERIQQRKGAGGFPARICWILDWPGRLVDAFWRKTVGPS